MDQSINLTFHTACREGNIEEVKRLIGGADPNYDHGSCVVAAVSENHIEIVKLLLLHGYTSRLIIAVQTGNIEMVKLFLTKESFIDCGEWSLSSACFYGYFDIILLLLEYANEACIFRCINKLFTYASNGKQVKIMDVLLKYPGIDLTDQNRFKYACENGMYEIVYKLLSLNANQNITNITLDDTCTSILKQYGVIKCDNLRNELDACIDGCQEYICEDVLKIVSQFILLTK